MSKMVLSKLKIHLGKHPWKPLFTSAHVSSCKYQALGWTGSQKFKRQM